MASSGAPRWKLVSATALASGQPPSSKPRDGHGGAELTQRVQHGFADQRAALSREHRLLAVDEEIAFPSRSEDDAPPRKRSRPGPIEQPRARAPDPPCRAIGLSAPFSSEFGL
jgi:hypothetical protein